MSEKTLAERAEAAKERIESECVLSLYGEAGEDGIFTPINDTERAYARYWTDEHYSWEDMVGDITDNAIMEGEASAITDKSCYDLIEAVAACKEDDALRGAACNYIRERLYEADSEGNDGTKQAACDAVEWTEISGAVLDFLRGEIAASDLAEADVDELDRIAPQA